MGSGTFSGWDAYKKRIISGRAVTGTPNSIYRANSLKDSLNPKNIGVRESRDGDDHPESTPIIIACDVTGSMSPVLNSVIQNLGTLNKELLARKPVTDPQVCFMGIGDAAAMDEAPLQVTQFESDIRQADALRDIWLEQRGGGNNSESYPLAWYFATEKIKADAIEKRGKKGYLFTMGDECCPRKLTKEQIKKVFGYEPQEEEYTAEELLDAVSRDWEVFHLVIEEGNYYSNRYMKDANRASNVDQSWELLGERVLHVAKHEKLAEIIVSAIQIIAGDDVKTVTESWNGDTGVVVAKAVGNLTNTGASGDFVEF